MYRITFFFKNFEQGWSETLFRSTPFGSSDTIFLQAYINRRLELLATTCVLTSVRMSNVDTKRDITLFDLPSGGRGGTWAYAIPSADGGGLAKTFTEDQFTALLLRLSDGQQNYRSFPMLGFPDHLFEAGVIVSSEEPLVRSRLNNWIAALTQASLGAKFQGLPAVAGKIVKFHSKEPDNQLVCLGLKGPIPAVGSLVMLGGVKPFRKLNRIFRIAAVAPPEVGDDGSIYLSGTDNLNTYGPVQGGTYKVPTYGVNVLNTYTISRLTSRKTGVPFGTVRGRR